jgi:hypothetical protein
VFDVGIRYSRQRLPAGNSLRSSTVEDAASEAV